MPAIHFPPGAKFLHGLITIFDKVKFYQTVGTKGGESMRDKGIRTRERVLAGATEIFHRQGFSGTSIHDLIREAGVKKGNLYHYFSSKGDTPSTRLAIHFEAIVRYHESRNLVGGCIFGNTALEMSDRNETYRAVIHDVFEKWRRRIRKGKQTG